MILTRYPMITSFFSINRYFFIYMDPVQSELCEGLYKQFSNLVEEMTNLCVESEKQLEEYKKNLHEKVIPEKVKYVSISLDSS